jgi:beta-glucosidase
MTHERKTFAVPENFLWGAATSAHQVEGNNVNSDWWSWEQSSPQYFEPSGDAVDSFHRFPEDMQLLADAGLTAYRFSLEWSRIEPVEGQTSRASLLHYRRMIDTALELGLSPVVTLHHFTSPRWFGEDGDWMSAKSVDRFARYVETVSDILEDVQWVCTINEPNLTAFRVAHERRLQEKDPGAGATSILPDTVVGQRLIEAHVVARDILHSRTEAKVGWTVANQALTPTPGNEALHRDIQYAWEDQYLEAARDDDFIGVQAYTSQSVDEKGVVAHPESSENTLTGWAYRPDALEMAVRHTAEVAPGVPILVTENGIATSDDARRIRYTGAALRGLLAAMSDGIDVRGYIHWSALDNFEWGKWEPTFGLIGVDRTTFARHPKPSLAWLGDIARNGTPAS